MKSTRYGSLILMGLLASLALSQAARSDVLFPAPTGDITTRSDWTTSQDSNGSTIQAPDVESDPGINGSGVLHFAYALGNGNWVNIQSPSFAATRDLSSQGNAISFYMKGDGLANQLKMEVTDTSGQDFQSVTVSSKSADWVKVTFPESSFTWAYGGSNVNPFDWTSVTQIGFTVVPGNGGSGTVSIDQVDLTNITGLNFTANYLVDDFSKPALNLLNSTRGDLGGNGQNLTVTASVVAPAPTYTYSYMIVSPSNGFYESLDTNNVNNQTYNGSTATANYLSFYLQANTNIPFDVNAELDYWDQSSGTRKYGPQVKVQNYIPNNTIPVGTWQQVLIPLQAFAGIDRFNLYQFSLLWTANSNTYKIYVGGLSFQALTATAQPDVPIDTMDTYYNESAWKALNSSGAQLTLATVPGYAGNAMQMQYAFAPFTSQNVPYVKMYSSLGFNLKANDANAFQFMYKGANETGSNTIEFKIIDDNQTTFEFKNPKVSNTNGQWETMTIPYSDFSYFGGSNHLFDWNNLTAVAIALSKGDGGQGDFYLHNIQYIKQADFQQTYPAGRLIENFSIDNNPFAPRTNSSKTTATFSFALMDTADVSLKIYDLAGNTVKKFDPVSMNSGTQKITWDGVDKYGNLVRNGLYLYMLTAQNKKTTQRVKNVIGVVR